MTILVTGAAGFIGSHVCHALLDRGQRVVGVDNLNDYYDVSLKEARLARLAPRDGYDFAKLDISDRAGVERVFADHSVTKIVNLAAQAGVRYSLEQPHSYLDSNVTGFLNLLECARHSDGFEHLLYASTSSVFGANSTYPLSESQPTEHPLSLYAATKKANEMMAHSYSHLFKIPATGVRFFTVYGPWGRPDMALFMFTKAILEGRPINVFNNGEMERDFTYVDDIVEGVVRLLDVIPEPMAEGDLTTETSPVAPYRIYNIGNARSVGLLRYIEALEAALGKKAEKNFMPMQPGDVKKTWADVADLEAATGYRPAVDVEEGVARFVEWYRDYYKV